MIRRSRNSESNWNVRACRFQNTLDNIDIFQIGLPSFNMRGRTRIPTIFGAILSFLIFNLIMVYFALKFQHLINRHNPQIASYEEQNAIDSSFIFNFKENNYRFAFAVEGFIDRETKEDN